MDSPDIQNDRHNPIDDGRSDEDRKVDAWAVLAIFTVLVLGAVHFVSGWTFDF